MRSASCTQETISDLDNALRKNDVNAETGDSTGSENINDLFRSMSDFTLTYKNLEILYYADKDLFIIESPLIEPWPSVTFGRYEQDNDVSNGPEPIQWDVITSDKGKLLLLSEYALDCVPYVDDSSADARRFGDTYLCEWLNGEFLGVAFTGEEAAVLQRDDNGDRVLVPGIKDMRNNSHRYCVPTKYALARGVETEKFYSVDCCGWWLDSIMDTDGDGYAEYGAMDAKGEVFYVPYGLVDDGVAVRPAIWVDAEEMIGLDSK